MINGNSYVYHMINGNAYVYYMFMTSSTKKIMYIRGGQQHDHDQPVDYVSNRINM